MYEIGAFKHHIIIGESPNATIDPNDTYFESHVTTPQTIAIIIPACQSSAINVPTPDATDFPPEKFKNTDLLCPKITKIAAITGKSPISTNAFPSIVAKITGKAPFIASNTITTKNHFLPMTRLTLVAPVEPEPIVLISCPVNSFTKIYPVGIDPIRYDIADTSPICFNLCINGIILLTKICNKKIITWQKQSLQIIIKSI